MPISQNALMNLNKVLIICHTVSDKTMQEVINALKSSGLVTDAQKTLLDAMPRIRNQACTLIGKNFLNLMLVAS